MPSIFLAKSNDSSLEVYSIVKHVLGLWVAQDKSNRSVLEWEKDKDHHKDTDILLIIPPENGLNTDDEVVTVGRGIYDFVADRSHLGKGYTEIIIVTSLSIDRSAVNIGCHQMKSREKLSGTSWKIYGELSLKANSYFDLALMLDVNAYCLPASMLNTSWNTVNGVQYSLRAMGTKQYRELQAKLTSRGNEDESSWVERQEDDFRSLMQKEKEALAGGIHVHQVGGRIISDGISTVQPAYVQLYGRAKRVRPGRIRERFLQPKIRMNGLSLMHGYGFRCHSLFKANRETRYNKEDEIF